MHADATSAGRPGTGAGLSRRRLLTGAGVGLALASCTRRRPAPSVTEDGPSDGDKAATEAGRLSARPQPQQRADATPGLQPLGLAGSRDGLRYVPAGYRPDRPEPLVLMLHGADGDAHGGLAPLLGLADQAGLLLVAPESRGRTWDVLHGGHGQDAAFVDEALAQTFSRYAVDPARLAVEGFSDGASYALALGLLNGDLFSHVIAFSPCFAARGATHGSPRLFISHGTGDGVLPIDDCSRRIVPRLQRAGYDLRYEEFDGPHVVPPELAREAVEWLTAERAAPP